MNGTTDGSKHVFAKETEMKNVKNLIADLDITLEKIQNNFLGKVQLDE